MDDTLKTRIQDILQNKAPREDVRVRYEFGNMSMVDPFLGGFWLWDHEAQIHQKTDLKQLLSSLGDMETVRGYVTEMRDLHLVL